MNDNISDYFPRIVYPITYPAGETEESLLNYLKGFSLEGSNGDELANYLREDFKRFVYTLSLLPQKPAGSSLLEIGANPYYTSILLKKFTDYDLFFTNHFGSNDKTNRQTQKNLSTKEEIEFIYVNNNIEYEELPFNKTFDVILFCEVLEHLIIDPVKAIMEIKKSLNKDGILILTTPNVNRLENVCRMISGTNIYDPYSGYGVYGRHNREYNKHELFMLLEHCGFVIEEMFSSDVRKNISNSYYKVDELCNIISKIENRDLDLGQYIFVRARNSHISKKCRPSWLFRSYPEVELCR